MGAQGEIYAVLGKRFQVERVNPTLSLDEEPTELFYNLNGKIIAITEGHRKDEYNFLDGFFDTPYRDIDLDKIKLGVKVLRDVAELGDRNFGSPIEALVGYGVANESYAGLAKALPSIDQLISLKSRLAKDIKLEFNIDVKESDLELHLLYEFSQ